MGMFDFNSDRAHGIANFIVDSPRAKVRGKFGGHSIPSSLAHWHQNLSGAGVAFLSSQLARKAGPRIRHSRVQSPTMVNIRITFPLSRIRSQNPTTRVGEFRREVTTIAAQ